MRQTIPIVAAPVAQPPAPAARPAWPARWGDAMQRHRGAIQAIQWAVVGAYALLLVVPVFLPLPPAGASIVDDLRLFAQFVFWGLWWPFVILSVMLVGRAWCGVFCPEGALTEFASRHGLGRSIPRWLRWGGWPVLAFIATTVYGQLISVYDHPRAALLILGGSTIAAVAVGYVYGQGKRVWCRYLCPVSGVFALLAQLSPLHFRADEAAWRGYRGPMPRVDCAPLLNLRQLDGASACHACGRCSGHRGAIALAARSPNAEILALDSRSEVSASLLLFGLLGVAVGAFQWSASPWFVALRQAAAQWLVARDAFALLDDDAPWWLLTHEPAANDVFSWLDGLLILGYIGGYALLAGGLAWLALRAAQGLLGTVGWRRLAMALVPLAGIGLFLGLSMTTVTHLRAEGVALGWVRPVRIALLALALGWSLWLAWRLVRRSAAAGPRQAAALALCAVPMSMTAAIWAQLLFVW
ncbi:MAG TPA: 4Fe-4S binding protein [Ideonella sp.]|nr:4Fe-4S binding protein [Ideonella sp.]HJV67629.1 4Fe-4S binding protein [Ideonella sp.]